MVINQKEFAMKRIAMTALAGFFCVTGMVRAQAGNPVVVMDTSMGKIKVELFKDKAPITVKNFLQYADDKFYEGTIFHRVIPTFMIQGGGFLPGMKEKETRPPIKNESANGLSNERGTIAMARTPDPDSATAQFFINVKENSGLDRTNFRDGVGYAVFGRVIEGMDVVDRIKQVQTGKRRGYDDVPTQDVVIRSVRRLDSK
jgi:cyclophilin family peptidyl-prolyl cis-trans isomerase